MDKESPKRASVSLFHHSVFEEQCFPVMCYTELCMHLNVQLFIQTENDKSNKGKCLSFYFISQHLQPNFPAILDGINIGQQQCFSDLSIIKLKPSTAAPTCFILTESLPFPTTYKIETEFIQDYNFFLPCLLFALFSYCQPQVPSCHKNEFRFC